MTFTSVTLRFSLDTRDIEEADDGMTSYFGGTYVLDGVKHQGYGNDRSDTFHHDIDEAILAKVEAEFGKLDDSQADDVEQGISEARDEVMYGPGQGLGSICVERTSEGFRVWNE